MREVARHRVVRAERGTHELARLALRQWPEPEHVEEGRNLLGDVLAIRERWGAEGLITRPFLEIQFNRVANERGDFAPADAFGDERVALRRRRQAAFEHEVPHVFERALPGQLGRVVLAVVEEALLAAHVADRRLGDLHALEAAANQAVEKGTPMHLCLGQGHRHPKDPATAILGDADRH